MTRCKQHEEVRSGPMYCAIRRKPDQDGPAALASVCSTSARNWSAAKGFWTKVVLRGAANSAGPRTVPADEDTGGRPPLEDSAPIHADSPA